MSHDQKGELQHMYMIVSSPGFPLVLRQQENFEAESLGDHDTCEGRTRGSVEVRDNASSEPVFVYIR